MMNRRTGAATRWTIVLAVCFLATSLPLRAQDTRTELIQEVGWEISTGNIQSALADAQRGVEEFPSSAILMHLLAVAQSKNGQQDKARKSFRKSIRLDATIPQNYYDLALLDMQAEDYTEATSMLKTFLRVSPQNAKGHLMLGIAYRKQNKDQLAVAQLKQSLAASPGLPLAHYNLGKIYASQGNNKAALDEFREELGVNPEFYDVYCSAGDAELAEKNYASAEALFHRGTQLRPLAWQAYDGIARVSLARNNLPKAESELNMVIALAPGNIDAHLMLARVYKKMGKPLDAKREELVVDTLRDQAKQVEDSPAPNH